MCIKLPFVASFIPDCHSTAALYTNGQLYLVACVSLGENARAAEWVGHKGKAHVTVYIFAKFREGFNAIFVCQKEIASDILVEFREGF
jgi:hypothetical protein